MILELMHYYAFYFLVGHELIKLSFVTEAFAHKLCSVTLIL